MFQGLEQVIREIVVVLYLPLAVWLAKQQHQRLPSGVEELDDLIGVASLALVACLHTYDPSRNTPLSSWISSHVQWALLDYLRSFDLLPQKQRNLVRLVQEAEKDLEQWFQRKPSGAEIATLLGCSAAEVEKIVHMGNIGIVLEVEEDLALEDRPEMGVGTGRPEQAAAFKHAFASLTVEEKVAVRMSAEDAILEDIANVLGVSVATAGRRVEKARRKLEESIL